jgi:hypothetical protein
MTAAVKLDSCTFYVKIRIWPCMDPIIQSRKGQIRVLMDSAGKTVFGQSRLGATKNSSSDGWIAWHCVVQECCSKTFVSSMDDCPTETHNSK